LIPYSLFLLAVLIVATPGICWWTALFPDDSAAEHLAWGSVLGFGAAVYVAYVCAFASLSWFYLVWAAILIVSLGGFIQPRRRLSLREWGEVAAGAVRLSNVALIMVLLLVAGLETDSLRRQIVPLGFDPSFHLLLAKKIALSGRLIHDWQPFENATLNYPIGSHLLIALFARFSGLSLPRAFQFLMVTFSLLSALAIYALASEYFASEIVGLYAAIAYSFWAFVGSTDYLRWGGLPNQFGMLLGLGIFSLAIREGEQRKRAALMALLFASVCLTHHHVMLTMGLILLGLSGFFWATNDPEKRYRTTFAALAAGSVAASFFLIPYAMKASSLSKTEVFRVSDNWPVLGPLLVVFALLGALLDYFRKPAKPHVFHFVSLMLLVLYALFGWVYYFYEFETKGIGFAAFTPSRFVTDLVYLLSLFAGYAFYRIQQYLGWRTPIMIAVALSLGYLNYPLWEQVFLPTEDPGRFAAYDWIQNNTPADSIVLTSDLWACYATWRRTLGTPMPVSEPRVPPRFSDRVKLELMAGLAPEESGPQLLEVFGPGQHYARHYKGKLLWANPKGWGVIQVYPGRL
jgi:hypothetical protein